MTPKQTALRNVGILVASSIVTGLAVGLLFTYFSASTVLIGVCSLLFAFAIKMVYDVELAKAEALDKLNK